VSYQLTKRAARASVAAAVATSSALSVPAFAQDSDALQEVTVTAQRRQQSVQDVGVSITALSGQQLRDLGVTSSKDIAKVAPGVVFDATASSGVNANLTVRGISQTDFSPNQESPNSV
jgi:iron complex outermembrane receptor protein